MTRSTRLLAIGVTVLVAALVVLLVSLRDQPDPIVVADAAPDAAAASTTAAPDDGGTATGTVGALEEGEARLPSPLEVPDGHEAVAVSIGYDAAVAALPAPGDTVNLYGVFHQGMPEQVGGSAPTGDGEAAATDKGVVRVLSGVDVLGVSGATAESGGGAVTLVLALSPADAERAIYLAAVEKVWFSLVDADHEPVEGAGVSLDTVLDD